jgi:hypothetical protein
MYLVLTKLAISVPEPTAINTAKNLAPEVH